MKATVSKTVISSNRDRGFESRPLRHAWMPFFGGFPEYEAMMKNVALAIAGFGNVGRAFFTLLGDKASEVEKRYGLRFEIKVIAKSDGCFRLKSGSLNLRHISRNGRSWTEGNPYWKAGLSLVEAIAGLEPGGCLIECTPSNLETGQPGYDHLTAALEKNWHAVTASKGALVHGFRKLSQLARKNGLGFGVSGATAAALPTLDVAMISLAGARIEGIEGILNGTTNYVLTRMSEGLDYQESLKEAQAKGIAEPDPSDDVNGRDAAAKLLILANACFDTDYALRDVRVTGISEIDPGLIQKTVKQGKSLKLLASASPRRKGGWHLEVMPAALDASHPLFHVNGTEKGITFLTDSMGSITVCGGRSNPRGTAAALLKDIINICKTDS